jgi:Ner family transcriptional regulator
LAAIGWHPEEIRAAIRMRGKTMAELSRSSGHDPDAVRNAIRFRRSMVVERLIAEFLDVDPRELWPDRYDAVGNRRRRARRAAAENRGGEP